MEEKIEHYFKFVEHRLKDKDYRFEYRCFCLLTQRLFADVAIRGLDALAAQRADAQQQDTKPVNIYIARHLSEFDWQEIQRSLASTGMMATIQAGDNLFIGPLDPFLRHFGGFKVFRKEARIFSPHWLADSVYRLLDKLWRHTAVSSLFTALRCKRRQPLIIDQTLSRDIYIAYMKHLIQVEGRDILIFPEYTKNAQKKIKYGRSYSGRLLDFTPLIFKLIRDINKKTDRKIQLVPVNVSYERVVEDQSFSTLEQMKTNRLTRPFTYLADYFFNYTHWIYQRNRGRVVVTFGEPVVLQKKMGFKIRLHEDLRKKVGELQAVFPTQILAYAFQEDTELSESELLARVDKTVSAMKNVKADLGYVEGLTAKEIVQSAYDHFDMHRKRRFLVWNEEKNIYVIKRKDILSQYRNHVLHLFEKWHDKEKLLKIIDIFRDGKDMDSF